MSLAPQAGLGHRGAGGGFLVNTDAQSKQNVRPHQIGLLARAALPTDRHVLLQRVFQEVGHGGEQINQYFGNSRSHIRPLSNVENSGKRKEWL